MWGYLESLYYLLDMDNIFLHIELLWLVLPSVYLMSDYGDDDDYEDDGDNEDDER